MSDHLGRRSFLRTVGCAASLVGAGCSARSGPRRHVDVPILASGTDVVRHERVPQSWVDHVRTVEKARRKLGELTWEFNEVTGLKIVEGEIQYGGRDGLRLGLELHPPEDPPDIPSEINGIPVSTESAPERGPSACYNDGPFDPMPGGAIVEPNDAGAFGTACCRVTDGGEPRLLTAAHMWRSCQGGIDTGSPAYQSGRHLGQVARYDTELDVALIESDGRIAFDDTIKLESETRLPVGGVVTDWGQAILLTNDDFVKKIGTSSGVTEGQLTAKNVEEGWNDCITFGGSGVEAEYKNVVGDSGGPVFYTHEGEAFLVSVQQMWLDKVGTDCDENVAGDRGRGTAAARITDKLGVTFGS